MITRRISTSSSCEDQNIKVLILDPEQNINDLRELVQGNNLGGSYSSASNGIFSQVTETFLTCKTTKAKQKAPFSIPEVYTSCPLQIPVLLYLLLTKRLNQEI